MPLDFASFNIKELKGSVNPENMTPMERLIYLRDFLRSGIPDTLWNFTCPHINPECGTKGCALGWWDYLTNRRWVRYETTWYAVDNGSENPFAMTNEEHHRCFTYIGPLTAGTHLNRNASPAEVADEIDRMLTDRKT